MKKLTYVILPVLAVSVVLFTGFHGYAITNTYFESFTSTTYKDIAKTTAYWNTTEGRVELFPFTLTLTGTYDSPAEVQDVVVAGVRAYVADGLAGVRAINISNPANPTSLGSYDTPGAAWGVEVDGNVLYVADGGAGLLSIDVTDPTVITPLGSYDTPGVSVQVAVAGDVAYVADASAGLRVVDISNPSLLSSLGSYDTPGSAIDVAVSGDVAYVADAASGVQVIDITDPSTPSLLGSYDTPDESWGVTVAGDVLFVADLTSGVQILDISDPASPTFIASAATLDHARDVAVDGDYAYVADRDSGMTVFDIRDPSTPTSMYRYDTLPQAARVTVVGEYAFLANKSSGLHIFNIAKPVPPDLAGNQATPGSAWGVVLAGDYAYVADGFSGLRVIDISDPTTLSDAGNLDTPGVATGVAIAGDYAYLTDGLSGLRVIDISDPTTPVSVTSYTIGLDNVQDVAVAGDHAFVVDGYRLEVLDISDPTTLVSVGGTSASSGYDICVDGNYAYIAAQANGLLIYDISDPTVPSLAGSFNTSGTAYGVFVAGDNAFVADGGSGLRILSVADPTSPSPRGTYDTPGTAWDVVLRGRLAYVADHSAVLVLDVTYLSSPTLLAGYQAPTVYTRLVTAGDHVFVTNGTGIDVFGVLQRRFDPVNNIAQSLPVDSSDDNIVKVKLSSTQSDSIVWEASTDGGSSFDTVLLDQWSSITTPGSDLVWKSTLMPVPSQPDTVPSCSSLDLEWLFDFCTVDSVRDVPNDQGGKVRTHLTRSGYDFADETSLPIALYQIWQRIDGAAAVQLSESQGSKPSSSDSEVGRASGPEPTRILIPGVTVSDDRYLLSVAAAQANGFPPGTWEIIQTIAPTQQHNYIVRTSTVADSSESGIPYAVYVVTTHTTTPSVWFVSHPDSGYSVDNIAPGVPTGFMAAYNTGSGNQLSWDPCPDEDFQFFNIYRDTDPDFTPAPGNLVQSTSGTSWTDDPTDAWQYSYKVTAVDHAGNESDPAGPDTYTAVEQPKLPAETALYQNIPNPFNPTTTIVFELATSGTVLLRIYDSTGSLVRTLLDRPMPAGVHRAAWDGVNEFGERVASGVYFYRLVAGSRVLTKKMVLLK